MKINTSIFTFLMILPLVLSTTRFSFGQESGKYFPLECDFCGDDLEPSGIAMFKGRLLFVSDNNENKAIYELLPAGRFYQTQRLINFNQTDLAKIDKNYKLDLEGIVAIGKSLYCVDERDRFVYRVNGNGRVKHIRHDILKYNKEKGISFSRKSNAGFEGIAYDPKEDIFFIANEREDALIYLLKKRGKGLKTINHISMTLLSGNPDFDISDLFYYKKYLYIIHRKENRIIKINPYRAILKDVFDYSRVGKGLYRSRKGYGFAEGLFITKKKIYLLFDSGGRTLIGKDYGEHGTLVILKRPGGF